ncbi:MAG: hypothetical protein ABIX28_04240 [Vicinamibacterales bacterium]
MRTTIVCARTRAALVGLAMLTGGASGCRNSAPSPEPAAPAVVVTRPYKVLTPAVTVTTPRRGFRPT